MAVPWAENVHPVTEAFITRRWNFHLSPWVTSKALGYWGHVIRFLVGQSFTYISSVNISIALSIMH